jgi:hypothetical protein
MKRFSKQPPLLLPDANDLSENGLLKSRSLFSGVSLGNARSAPVVKRTSRRSPEPQVRVRFPAGARKNPNNAPSNRAQSAGTTSLFQFVQQRLCVLRVGGLADGKLENR